jgi:O-antigen/teichoic acid export membrane protein
VALFRLHDRIAHAFSWFVLAYLPNMTLRPLSFLLFVFLTWFLGFQLSASLVMALQLCALASLALIQYVFLRQGLRQFIKGVKPVYETHLWLRTAAPLLLATLFVQFFPEINVVIIGVILPPEDVAVFYASFRVALLLAFFQSAVNALMIPSASRLHAAGDRGALQQLVARTTQLRFWLALCGLIVLALIGRTVLGWFGEEFVAGYASLLILALAQLVLAAVGPVDQLLNITGHQNQCLYAFTAALIIAVVLNMVLVPKFGILGAAWAVVLVMVLWTLWLHQVVVKQLGIRPSVLSFASVFTRTM